MPRGCIGGARWRRWGGSPPISRDGVFGSGSVVDRGGLPGRCRAKCLGGRRAGACKLTNAKTHTLFLCPPTRSRRPVSSPSCQARFEWDAQAVRDARRKAFADAQAAVLSLREIADEAGLHHSRIAEVIQGK